MEDIYCKSFTLNNSLAAISAYMSEDNIFATDGIECYIHRIGGNCCNERIRTQRTYRRLRNNDSETLTALGCCSDTRLYFLSDCFEETGYVSLDTSTSRCGSGLLGPLSDASITTIGNERFIVGAFEKTAYLFDMNGKRLTRLCSAEKNEIITDFISLGNDIFALGTSNGNLRTVTVVDSGKEYSGIVNKNYVLRMIFSYGSDIYGLFGRNYIYNRIIKIYSDGAFTLPEGQKL